MIYFDDIFERAIKLFDDPDISRNYYYDPANYQSIMSGFLMIGRNKFTHPTAVTDKLSEIDGPEGKEEIIDGTGTDTYVLESQPKPHSGFTFRINGEIVQGTYDAEASAVTFERAVNEGETCSVAWFYAGAFTADFSTCFRADFSMSVIMDKIINILAYAILSSWGDKEVGRVLEVRNILTDTDFKMYSPANSAKAKVEWRNQMNRDMDTLSVDLNWRIFSTPTGGSRFGR